MKVNQMSYRVYTRQPSSKVGNNTRDEPADLAKMTFAGQNRIRLKVSRAYYYVSTTVVLLRWRQNGAWLVVVVVGGGRGGVGEDGVGEGFGSRELPFLEKIFSTCLDIFLLEIRHIGKLELSTYSKPFITIQY